MHIHGSAVIIRAGNLVADVICKLWIELDSSHKIQTQVD